MFFLGPLGPTELVLILVVILVIFGVGKLPEIGEGLGKGILSFRRAIKDEKKPTTLPPTESTEKDGQETKE